VFLKLSYQLDPCIGSKIDFSMVWSMHNPDIEIGIRQAWHTWYYLRSYQAGAVLDNRVSASVYTRCWSNYQSTTVRDMLPHMFRCWTNIRHHKCIMLCRLHCFCWRKHSGFHIATKECMHFVCKIWFPTSSTQGTNTHLFILANRIVISFSTNSPPGNKLRTASLD